MENKIFPVTVDYRLSLDEMIRAGKYFDVNLTPSENSRPKQSPKQVEQVNIEFVEFHENCQMQPMLDRFAQLGFRPSNLPEFLALGAQHPSLLDEYIITTLDAVERRHFINFRSPMTAGEDRLIPCLLKLEGNRVLYWAPFDGEYRPGFLFACVRK